MRKLAAVDLVDVVGGRYQMRRGEDDEAFGELVASVRADGVLVPVLLRSSGEGYEIVAGHRRVEAARLAGLREVPAQIIEGEGIAGWGGAFAENMFRVGLSAVEEGAGIVEWMQGTGADVDEVARGLHRSRGWVEERISMLEWPGDVLAAVHSGKMSVAAGRNLAGIADAGHRGMLIDYAVENGASARVTAAWRQAWDAGKACRDPGSVEPEPGRAPFAAIEPYTPCVVCGAQDLMRSMRYLPLCGSCQDAGVGAAARLRRGGDVADGAGG